MIPVIQYSRGIADTLVKISLIAALQEMSILTFTAVDGRDAAIRIADTDFPTTLEELPRTMTITLYAMLNEDTANTLRGHADECSDVQISDPFTNVEFSLIGLYPGGELVHLHPVHRRLNHFDILSAGIFDTICQPQIIRNSEPVSTTHFKCYSLLDGAGGCETPHRKPSQYD